MKHLTSLERSILQLKIMSRLQDVFSEFENDIQITPEYILETLVKFMQEVTGDNKVELPYAYVSLEKYSRNTEIPLDTCRTMVADGRIITRPKKRAKDRIEVNMIAMLKDAVVNS
ncbi:Putative DNA-binding protein (modular protein) [Xenorhabdus bovienii str. oregonense]|uniref:Putative DNA-binding protein (Modular protein) n=2 Tax=Xenorhabdus bovienii TaxID=40576 RepID=A0A077NWQ6_XENBV|nr:Putative DNA-binding protein (modular protein) [Xenorhabdus bovienii str. oregonense]